MPHDRKATTYNQIVGITKAGTLYVLDDIFKYTDGFKGATRYEMEPLTDKAIEIRSDDEVIEQLYADSETDRSFENWKAVAQDELGADQHYIGDDPSFRTPTAKAFDALTPEQKALIEGYFAGRFDGKRVDWDCVCCGRCGKISEDDFEIIINHDLLGKIIEAES